MKAVRKTIEWQVEGRTFLLNSSNGRFELQTPDGQLLDLSEAEWREVFSALGELGLRKAPPQNLPGRAGEPWEAEEDSELRQCWLKGMTASEIAAKHLRTTGAIEARLVRLQLVATRDEARARRALAKG